MMENGMIVIKKLNQLISHNKKRNKNKEMERSYTDNNYHQLPIQAQPTITHFSHPHPLQTLSSQTLALASCSACRSGFPYGDTVYGCTTCSFFLHRSCSELLPLINHPAHPHHQLSLTFAAPYPNGMFSCDICTTPGTAQQWLYRCGACGFDSHLSCARTAFTGPKSTVNLTLDSPYANPNNYYNNFFGQAGLPTQMYGQGQFNAAAPAMPQLYGQPMTTQVPVSDYINTANDDIIGSKLLDLIVNSLDTAGSIGGAGGVGEYHGRVGGGRKSDYIGSGSGGFTRLDYDRHMQEVNDSLDRLGKIK